MQMLALNHNPKFKTIKITFDPTPLIRPIDNPHDDATFRQTTDTPFCNERLGTEFNSLEQNFGPTYLTTNDNKQLPIPIHMQNGNNDLNNQVYDCDDQENEPSFQHNKFQTKNTPQNDNQSIKFDTHTKQIQAQIHSPPSLKTYDSKNVFSPRIRSLQHGALNNNFYDILPIPNVNFNPSDISLTDDSDIKQDSQNFPPHDDRQIVMANDENFGALDFQAHNFYSDAENVIWRQLVDSSLSSDFPMTNKPNDNDGRLIHNNNELESNVENKPQLEPGSQTLPQQDTVKTVDPVPESRYNLRHKNRINPYTFSGKVSEKWQNAPCRNRKIPPTKLLLDHKS
jgi:hypothetical protein